MDLVDDHFDLAVIGSGSGNSLLDEKLAHLKVAQIERGTFGGTCLNVGCIPTKMFVLPADYAKSPLEARRLGVDLDLRDVHFEAIRDRIFSRIDPISEAGLQWRQQSSNVSVFRGTAAFDDPHTLRIALNDGGSTRITADRFVLASGSRPNVLEVPGADDPEVASRIHTSDTVMRLPERPRTMVIIGGGYIACEFAHIFSGMCTKVTLVQRSGRLLRHLDDEISDRFTELFAERVSVRLNQRVSGFESGPGSHVTVLTEDENGIEYDYAADVVLVAIGRRPNSDLLDLGNAGVEIDDEQFVRVDDYQRTTAPHIWALGDICSHHMLKHVANAEERVVHHNLLHPDDLVATDHRFVPSAVFSDPQVACVGASERELAGRRYARAVQAYGTTAYGWALEDTTHVCKLLADPDTKQLLGAHIIGPQASTLIQPLIQAMSFGLPYDQMARGQYWIHPALPEVVENALLALRDGEVEPQPAAEIAE